jgi:hypothetical protein
LHSSVALLMSSLSWSTSFCSVSDNCDTISCSNKYRQSVNAQNGIPCTIIQKTTELITDQNTAARTFILGISVSQILSDK